MQLNVTPSDDWLEKFQYPQDLEQQVIVDWFHDKSRKYYSSSLSKRPLYLQLIWFYYIQNNAADNNTDKNWPRIRRVLRAALYDQNPLRKMQEEFAPAFANLHPQKNNFIDKLHLFKKKSYVQQFLEKSKLIIDQEYQTIPQNFLNSMNEPPYYLSYLAGIYTSQVLPLPINQQLLQVINNEIWRVGDFPKDKKLLRSLDSHRLIIALNNIVTENLESDPNTISRLRDIIDIIREQIDQERAQVVQSFLNRQDGSYLAQISQIFFSISDGKNTEVYQKIHNLITNTIIAFLYGKCYVGETALIQPLEVIQKDLERDYSNPEINKFFADCFSLHAEDPLCYKDNYLKNFFDDTEMAKDQFFKDIGRMGHEFFLCGSRFYDEPSIKELPLNKQPGLEIENLETPIKNFIVEKLFHAITNQDVKEKLYQVFRIHTNQAGLCDCMTNWLGLYLGNLDEKSTVVYIYNDRGFYFYPVENGYGVILSVKLSYINIATSQQIETQIGNAWMVCELSLDPNDLDINHFRLTYRDLRCHLMEAEKAIGETHSIELAERIQDKAKLIPCDQKISADVALFSYGPPISQETDSHGFMLQQIARFF
ncbi:MAG: hypothetical protein LRY67_05230 [Gammaproteobacteria bacterium]|nr:hypothetical protein [Gammaproteobacteria bacterium]